MSAALPITHRTRQRICRRSPGPVAVRVLPWISDLLRNVSPPAGKGRCRHPPGDVRRCYVAGRSCSAYVLSPTWGSRPSPTGKSNYGFFTEYVVVLKDLQRLGTESE